MTGNTRKLLALAGVVASIAAVPAHATLFAQAIVLDAQDIKQDTGVMVLNAEANFTQGGRTSVQSAIASYGVLKTFSQTSSSEVQGLTGSAQAGWIDTIVLNHAGLAGTAGTLRLNFSYNYSLSASTVPDGVAAEGYFLTQVDVDSASASYHANAHRQIDNHDGVSELSGYGTVRDAAGEHASSDTGFSMDVDFVWGTPIRIMQTASTLCGVGFYAGAPGASCTADASHSTYWGGITDVTTGGMAISDFTLTSASGTDYSTSFVPQPVPEPAQVWMLAGGALVGAMALRRRKVSARIHQS